MTREPTEMELRVAEALFNHEHLKMPGSNFAKEPKDLVAYWVEGARAAIRAMREPTQLMTVRGTQLFVGPTFDDVTQIHEANGSEIWKRMIDTASPQ